MSSFFVPMADVAGVAVAEEEGESRIGLRHIPTVELHAVRRL